MIQIVEDRSCPAMISGFSFSSGSSSPQAAPSASGWSCSACTYWHEGPGLATMQACTMCKTPRVSAPGIQVTQPSGPVEVAAKAENEALLKQVKKAEAEAANAKAAKPCFKASQSRPLDPHCHSAPQGLPNKFTASGSNVTISGSGTVATKTSVGDNWTNAVATIGEALHEGVHCWELQCRGAGQHIMAGVCRVSVNVASTDALYNTNDALGFFCPRRQSARQRPERRLRLETRPDHAR